MFIRLYGVPLTNVAMNRLYALGNNDLYHLDISQDFLEFKLNFLTSV